MNELQQIKRHNFDKAVIRLKEFSENTQVNHEIEEVDTDGGLFNLGDHKVTGREFNRRLSTIQNYFINSNRQINEIIKEFREVYNTFEALDTEYIRSILINVSALEKTSNDVRRQQEMLNAHQTKIFSQQDKLETQNEKITSTIEDIKKIVKHMKIITDALNSYNHLSDIDDIWKDCEYIKAKMHETSSEVKKCMKDISTFKSQNQKVEDNITALKDNIESTAQQLNDQIETIQGLIDFRTKLESIEHLNDVDEFWQVLQEHSNALVAIKEQEKILEAYIKNNEKEFNTKVLELVQTNEIHVERLTKHLSKAYWIGVGALSLSIIEFIIIFMR